MMRRARRLWGVLARESVGEAITIPEHLLELYPLLGEATWRRGGFPLRVGGWMLGRRMVAGITLGRVVFLAPDNPPSVRLMLHELGHVRQFERDKVFPMRYLWESLRRGYTRNQYEAEADQFAEEVLWSSTPRRPS